jgi:hypothetical protein
MISQGIHILTSLIPGTDKMIMIFKRSPCKLMNKPNKEIKLITSLIQSLIVSDWIK